jgi:hypothetical protein
MFLPKNFTGLISQKKKLYAAVLFCVLSLLIFGAQLHSLRYWREGELTRVRVVLHDQVQEQQDRFCEVLPGSLQEAVCPDFYRRATFLDHWCGNDIYFSQTNLNL